MTFFAPKRGSHSSPHTLRSLVHRRGMQIASICGIDVSLLEVREAGVKTMQKPASRAGRSHESV